MPNALRFVERCINQAVRSELDPASFFMADAFLWAYVQGEIHVHCGHVGVVDEPPGRVKARAARCAERIKSLTGINCVVTVYEGDDLYYESVDFRYIGQRRFYEWGHRPLTPTEWRQVVNGVWTRHVW